MSQLRFDNQVAVVTGAGAGMGKLYALFFASRGAKVVVNDLGGSLKGEGASSRVADLVVEEIKKNGGTAVANYDSVEQGANIIKTAIDSFGRVDILVNNAGILRDKSFLKMTKDDWDLVFKVHLHGTYETCKAAWASMRQNKYGRIINVASGSGLYGSFGQANYAAAKMAILGFTQTLAKEGKTRNIHCNTICPLAASRMTETMMNAEQLKKLDPSYVLPMVGYLCHSSCKETGSCFELGGGYFGKVRFQRAQGVVFPNEPPTPEQVLENFEQIVDFSQENEYPTNFQEVIPKFTSAEFKEKAKPKKLGPKLESDRVFEAFTKVIESGKKQEIVETLGATYGFEVVSRIGSAPLKTWVIDFSGNNPKIYEGSVGNTDVVFTVTDEIFPEIWDGYSTLQRAFDAGKLEVRGKFQLAMLFDPTVFNDKVIKPKL